MLTTVPVSSVSLTGLPSPNWTHLWRELLPSPWWRGVDLAGLPEMTTMPSLTEPTVELESGRTSSRSSGTMLWQPTIGPAEDGAILAGPAKPWTPTCREVCANLWPWCSDRSSSADELTGPLDASSVGAPLWNVECWTASWWTGSLDLVWDQTSRSWWSSQETGAPWWLSGRAVELVPGYLPWSASRLSRRVASHLAALTARRRTQQLGELSWGSRQSKRKTSELVYPLVDHETQILADSLMYRNMKVGIAYVYRYRPLLTSVGGSDRPLRLHLEVWNYHVAVEGGQVDYRSQISCLLGHQEQPTVES